MHVQPPIGAGRKGPSQARVAVAGTVERLCKGTSGRDGEQLNGPLTEDLLRARSLNYPTGNISKLLSAIGRATLLGEKVAAAALRRKYQQKLSRQ